MLVKIHESETASIFEVSAHADRKRYIVLKLIRDSVDKPIMISFWFPLVLGEFTVHSFELDSSSENYGIICGSLRTYIRSFSDEILNSVRIFVAF